MNIDISKIPPRTLQMLAQQFGISSPQEVMQLINSNPQMAQQLAQQLLGDSVTTNKDEDDWIERSAATQARDMDAQALPRTPPNTFDTFDQRFAPDDFEDRFLGERDYEKNYMGLQKAMRRRTGNAGEYDPLPGFSEHESVPLRTERGEMGQHQIENLINRGINQPTIPDSNMPYPIRPLEQEDRA